MFFLFATYVFTQEFRRYYFHSFLVYLLTLLALNRVEKGEKVILFGEKRGKTNIILLLFGGPSLLIRKCSK